MNSQLKAMRDNHEGALKLKGRPGWFLEHYIYIIVIRREPYVCCFMGRQKCLNYKTYMNTEHLISIWLSYCYTSMSGLRTMIYFAWLTVGGSRSSDFVEESDRHMMSVLGKPKWRMSPSETGSVTCCQSAVALSKFPVSRHRDMMRHSGARQDRK